MSFKADANSKKLFDQVAEKMELTSSDLLNIFVTCVVRKQAVPFNLKVVPDKNETLMKKQKSND